MQLLKVIIPFLMEVAMIFLVFRWLLKKGRNPFLKTLTILVLVSYGMIMAGKFLFIVLLVGPKLLWY